MEIFFLNDYKFVFNIVEMNTIYIVLFVILCFIVGYLLIMKSKSNSTSSGFNDMDYYSSSSSRKQYQNIKSLSEYLKRVKQEEPRRLELEKLYLKQKSY